MAVDTVSAERLSRVNAIRFLTHPTIPTQTIYRYTGIAPDHEFLEKLVAKELASARRRPRRAYARDANGKWVRHCCYICHGQAKHIHNACRMRRWWIGESFKRDCPCHEDGKSSKGGESSKARGKPVRAAVPKAATPLAWRKVRTARIPGPRRCDSPLASSATPVSSRSSRAERRTREEVSFDPDAIPASLRTYNKPGKKEAPESEIRRRPTRTMRSKQEVSDDEADEDYEMSDDDSLYDE